MSVADGFKAWIVETKKQGWGVVAPDGDDAIFLYPPDGGDALVVRGVPADTDALFDFVEQLKARGFQLLPSAAATPSEPAPDPATLPFLCGEEGCGRRFKSKQAVGLHHTRMHRPHSGPVVVTLTANPQNPVADPILPMPVPAYGTGSKDVLVFLRAELAEREADVKALRDAIKALERVRL